MTYSLSKTTLTLSLAIGLLLTAVAGSDAARVYRGSGAEADTVFYVAEAGEQNQLSINQSQQSVYFKEAAGRIPIDHLQGGGCVAAQDDWVACFKDPDDYPLVTSVKVLLKDQNDVASSVLDSIPTEISGGEGNDQLFGGAAPEILNGETGDDLISGLDGADRLVGNQGNDSLYGGNGSDTLLGVGDHDTLDGGLGNDFIGGGSGSDVVSYSTRENPVTVDLTTFAQDGENGESDHISTDVETIYGGKGDDRLSGDDGATTLFGGGGNDILNGRGGTDILLGSNGHDIIFGAGDNDIATGGEGNDLISGGDGNDLLRGDAGRDQQLGGTGDDRIDSQDNEADVDDCGEGEDNFLADPIDVLIACEPAEGEADGPAVDDPQLPDDSNQGQGPISPATTPAVAPQHVTVTAATAAAASSPATSNKGTGKKGRFQVVGKAIKLRKGKVLLKLRCSGSTSCRGYLKFLTLGKKRLATKSIRLKAGKTKLLRVKLSKKTTQRLRRTKALVIVATDRTKVAQVSKRMQVLR